MVAVSILRALHLLVRGGDVAPAGVCVDVQGFCSYFVGVSCVFTTDTFVHRRIGAVRGADVAKVNMELSNVELTTLQRIILVPPWYSRGALSVTASPTHKFGWTSFACFFAVRRAFVERLISHGPLS